MFYTFCILTERDAVIVMEEGESMVAACGFRSLQIPWQTSPWLTP